METPAGNPEHEPARRRLSLLTLGSRRCPGPGPARGHPPPPRPRQPAGSLALQQWLVSHACPGLTRGAAHPEGPRAPTRPAAPRRCQRERASEPRRPGRKWVFHVGVCLRSRSLLFGGRPGPLCSDLSPPKLISRTCQFALVWKILKTPRNVPGTRPPASPQRCPARALGRSRGCGVGLEPTAQTRSPAPPRPSPKLPDAPRRPGRARGSCITSPAARSAPGRAGASRRPGAAGSPAKPV